MGRRSDCHTHKRPELGDGSPDAGRWAGCTLRSGVRIIAPAHYTDWTAIAQLFLIFRVSVLSSLRYRTRVLQLLESLGHINDASTGDLHCLIHLSNVHSPIDK